jgi:DNA-directed RNA polymerase subunit RPC12/RpoP
MLSLSSCLSFYKREDIQKEIILHARHREVAFKYGESGFGKRPDILQYEHDIIELAKQGMTSLHASEELWDNPLRLNAGMAKSELDELRSGWDLILDIDCPSWNISKIIAWLIIKALKDHQISCYSIKFSGNKGFHIGIPFEAFPSKINNIETRLLFPEGPKKIASYLLNYISMKYIKVSNDNDIVFGSKFKVKSEHINKIKTKEKLMEFRCKECGKKVIPQDNKEKIEYVCPKCSERIFLEEDLSAVKCPRCSYPFMENMKRKFSKRIEHSKSSICSCGSTQYVELVNAGAIIEVDTLLISQRHLYRMPYSLHEKSGLCSIPFNPEHILQFDKKYAKPELVKVSKLRFLEREHVHQKEAMQLLLQALDFAHKEESTKQKESKIYELPTQAIGQQYFPPCMLKGLLGMKDGRKRFVFALTNFLTSAAWSYDAIEALIKEWNKKNSEALREVVLVSQLRYHKQRKQTILPPNCRSYYEEIGICTPDNLCERIKNPVSYAKRKMGFKETKKGKI